MHWSVSIEQAADNSGNNNIRLGLKDQSGEVVWVTEGYASLEEWKQDVLRLKEELESALEQGVRDWVNKMEVKSEAKNSSVESPEEIWEQMQEFEDEQELSSFFNQLGEEERKRTADYILTQVNMFKGNAPYFAQNYDSKSNKLA